MNIGDIVVVTGSSSIPKNFLGTYGVIKDVLDYNDDTKVLIEFKRQTKHLGSLFHSARESDLEKIGETNY